MAWDTKYRCEWTDILNLDWKVDIEDETAASTITTMQTTGDPMSIEFMAGSDDLFDNPIKGSRADLRVYSTTNFQYINLIAVEDMQWRMSIYYNDGSDHLYWRGFVITNNYQEPYDGIPYTVTISASDGLGVLKNMLYKYTTSTVDDTCYDGRLLGSEIIIDILTKIGITGFTEYVNIYEESMTTTTSYSPLDQIRIDVDVFKDMYCYDVLEEILKIFNANIRIVAGVAIIYRPVEIAGSTVYGRIFTADTTHTATNFTPVQYINRTTHTSDIRDYEGGTMMIQGPAKKVTIHQDYGNKESWIENWKFEGNKFSGSILAGFEAESWIKAGSMSAPGILPINRGIPAESDGVILNAKNNYPDFSKYIYQQYGTYGIVGASDILSFEFEYRWFNETGGTVADAFYYMVRDVSSDYSIAEEADDIYADWVTPAAKVEVAQTLPEGDSGWLSYKRIINGLDVAGLLEVRFYNPDDTNVVYLGIKNVRFIATSDDVVIKKVKKKIPFGYPFRGLFAKKYRWVSQPEYIDNIEVVRYSWEKTNAISGEERDYEMIIGDVTKSGTGGTGIDNVLEQFAGSIATTSLNFRVDTVTLTGTSGTANITCNGVTKLATFTADLEGTAEQFVTDWGASGGDYYLSGIQVSFSGSDIIFTALVKGWDFTGSTAIVNVLSDLSGTVALTTAKESNLTYSTDWNTRGGSESKELLSIIVDELADQYSRPKQFLSLPIREFDSTGKTPHINLIGNMQDDLNQVGGNNRIFVFNKGIFNVKDREWNVDLIEII